MKVRLSNQIRYYRLRRKLKLNDVALLVGYGAAAHISHWESGSRLPSLSSAMMLSAALKCPIEILFLDKFNQIRKEIYERQQRHNINLEYE